ncbi:FecR family protein [Longimicrobium sp.]|uniref:FecR family protein n=1 Tax=Longimicrobium sp. TaxID=2029185 RepID=UPI002E31C5A3|nr:FecR domain-containing protein [Longimicrobium sp.]HEX6042774.1 FecR domain-containing protein [Longimicrobium sp.]
MEKDELTPETASPDTDWDALARFLAGESPDREAEAVRAWLAENPDRQAVLGALDRAMTRAATPPPADLDVDAALGRVHRRMDAPATTVVSPRRPPSTAARRGWRSPVLRAAAALLLATGGWFGIQAVRDGGGEAMVTAYATEIGERETVRLTDGTTVLLGPASRVTIPEGYGERDRTVDLVGEAMFDVVHDARPFTVRAGMARVRDIGTAFSVQSGPAGVRVVVTEGAVALAGAREAGEGVVLRQGERGVIAAEGAAPQRAAATAEDLAWTRGELVFRDAPLAQVAAEMRRWYGVEVRADDAVAARRLTASFEGEPRERVLEVMALALGAEMTMRGDTAVLSAAGR